MCLFELKWRDPFLPPEGEVDDVSRKRTALYARPSRVKSVFLILSAPVLTRGQKPPRPAGDTPQTSRLTRSHAITAFVSGAALAGQRRLWYSDQGVSILSLGVQASDVGKASSRPPAPLHLAATSST